MLKKHSRIKFFLLAIIAIIGILLCVCPFSIPGSNNKFNAFVPAINKGIELNGGVEVAYQATLKEGATQSLDQAIEDAQNKIYDLYVVAGHSELYVNKLGNDKVQMIMSSSARVADEAYGYLESEKPINMTLTEASDTSGEIKTYVVGTDVKSAKADYSYDSESYGINLNFTSTGLEHIETMKNNAQSNATVYIYCGEVKADNLVASVKIDEVEDGMFITSDTFTSANVVQYAHNIIAGSLNVSLENIYANTISPSLGVNTNLYIIIALVVMIVATMVLIYVRYGHFGLIGSLAMTFFLVFFAFLLQAIPFVTLNLTGVIACVIAYLIALISICYIFEKIKEEYAAGKKIHISCKGAFKKALWPIIDSHVVGALASIFIWIFAPASVKIFGIAIFVGLVLSIIISLGLLRWFVYLYLPLNTSKPKKLRLYRDKNVKEIKEDEVEIIPEDQVNSQTMEGENE